MHGQGVKKVTFEYGSDEEVKSVGEYLRKRRQARDLSLEEVSEKTKIHVKFLNALESGQDLDLPGPTYRDLFLKSYCEFLGISMDELYLRLPEMEPPKPGEETHEPPPTPKPGPSRPPEPAGPITPGTPPNQPNPLSPQSKRGSTFLVATLIVLVIVLAIIAVQTYRGRLFSQPQLPEQKLPVSPEPMVEQQLDDSLVTDTMISIPAAQEMINMLIVGRGECWIEVRIDGDSAFSELMKTNDTLWLAMQDSITMKLGLPTNVDVWANAQPLRVANPGEASVKEVTLTRDNYTGFVDSTRIGQ